MFEHWVGLGFYIMKSSFATLDKPGERVSERTSKVLSEIWSGGAGVGNFCNVKHLE